MSRTTVCLYCSGVIPESGHTEQVAMCIAEIKFLMCVPVCFIWFARFGVTRVLMLPCMRTKSSGRGFLLSLLVMMWEGGGGVGAYEKLGLLCLMHEYEVNESRALLD